jgi:threonine/homoserine/homoserine lactone efflux protein
MKFKDFWLFLLFVVLIILLSVMMPELTFTVTTDPYLFLAFVVLISLSGVMMPGPLFAATIEKAAKRKNAGLLISVGHGIVEFPLMVLLYFVMIQFVIPDAVKITVMLVGGSLMIYMGVQAFRNRNKANGKRESSKHGSLIAGIWTTAANPGFIIWWLTIGTTLVMNAKFFGLLCFSVFAVIHWLCDFLWYTIMAVAIFKSRRFWTERVHQAIFVFCFAVFVGFGIHFISSSLWLAINTFV